MGYYTSFEFEAPLSPDAPAELVEYLNYRLGAGYEELNETPYEEHRFFACERWDWLLSWRGDQEYASHSSWFRRQEQQWVIHIETNLKNYCGSIEWFLVWIAPYLTESLTIHLARTRGEDQEQWHEFTGSAIKKLYEERLRRPLIAKKATPAQVPPTFGL